MSRGIVKTWIAERGFGFVEPEGGGPDLFVHVSAIGGLPELITGQQVEFDEEFDRTRNKFKAINVRVIGAPQLQRRA